MSSLSSITLFLFLIALIACCNAHITQIGCVLSLGSMAFPSLFTVNSIILVMHHFKKKSLVSNFFLDESSKLCHINMVYCHISKDMKECAL